ncbi:glycosyltransferase [Peribacillus butanolivorans]|uniref:glycosyltransferase n=1 Tax=Peribacillus butanolivorans TaxID=421767 RepID=UPI0036D09C21
MYKMNKGIRHICFIMGPYPIQEHPINTFVAMLIQAVAKQGVKCTVIAPQSITEHFVRKISLRKEVEKQYIDNKNFITIYSPKYISFSSKELFGFNTYGLTQSSYEKAILKEYRKRKINADVLYAHFFLPSGIAALKLSDTEDIPVFIANGEADLSTFRFFDKNILREATKKITGIISVSSKNKTELIESEVLNSSIENNIIVIPNAIDKTIFYQIDQQKIRNELKMPTDAFIVAFTGSFIKRKGVDLLSQALEKVEGVYSIFIGNGPIEPSCGNILYKGSLPHNEIYKYLNAADVFALPTEAEGCPNATIEAMACGLPIISSDLPFNDDILDDQNSIRIDRNDIDKIADAIRFLRDNPQKRQKMSKASLSKARELDIETRAKKVITYIEQQSGE